ncbi:hypothetical protein, partial [Massilia solisilvae]
MAPPPLPAALALPPVPAGWAAPALLLSAAVALPGAATGAVTGAGAAVDVVALAPLLSDAAPLP